MTAPEIPPAVEHIDYSFEKSGCWLRWHPVQGAPVSIFIPNRFLGTIAHLFSGRVAALAESGEFRPGP